MDNKNGIFREGLTLETYEWDQTWIENTEDLTSPRILYIGDSISIPTRAKLNELFGSKIRVDGFASSKALDHPYFTESVRLFTAQQAAPYRAVLFNNGLHGWHLDDTDAYERLYARKIEELRALLPQAAFILLLTTPTLDPDTDARVQSRNRAVIKAAKTFGLQTVDLYRADPDLPSYLCSDGVHFTDEGYRILAKTVAAALEQVRTTVLETERLVLRRWEESDAEDLYTYAGDPAVGPIAGWPAHQSLDESREVIRNVFNGKEAYAVCLKEDGKAIGAIELKLNGHTDMTERDDECELGYWLGKPFWGRGLISEAVKEMLRRAFEDLGMRRVWCGYYEGNAASKRVQEKAGFRYRWTTEGVDVPLMHEKRTGHVNAMTKEEWETMRS
ncbi:MAG: GNAT family N-acetyltransferase [Clostridia bacterium]|nr:GNAT family N-acetyltransferase [Clostridia bacterium]